MYPEHTFPGFTQYLVGTEGDIFNPEHEPIHQDMDHPLSHYFINSSHNTWTLCLLHVCPGCQLLSPFLQIFNRRPIAVQVKCRHVYQSSETWMPMCWKSVVCIDCIWQVVCREHVWCAMLQLTVGMEVTVSQLSTMAIHWPRRSDSMKWLWLSTSTRLPPARKCWTQALLCFVQK